MDKYSTIPAVNAKFRELEGLAKATRLIGASLSAIVDNSTGTGTTITAVSTRRSRFTHVASATDLITKAAFDTAMTKANNATSVLAGLVNEIASEVLPSAELTGGNGTVAVAGTIPAQDKAITASEGATAVAQDRAGFNAGVAGVRNNQSTIILAVNRLCELFGLSKIADKGDGTAIQSRILANKAAATTAVDNTGDAVPKTSADAAFTALANNAHVIGLKIDEIRTHFTAIAPGLGLPAQFAADEWSVADASTSGDIVITISELPADGGAVITDLEYRIDNGAWTSLAGTTADDYPVAGLTDDVEVTVQIRAVSSIGNGPASAGKTVTPTA